MTPLLYKYIFMFPAMDSERFRDIFTAVGVANILQYGCEGNISVIH